MRKSLIVLLCLIVSICFAGCTFGEEDASFLVGFGREDITPKYSVPLGGYPGNRGSDAVLDPLYATCIAFTDGDGNTVVMFHTDLLSAPAVSKVRKELVDHYGIPSENIIVAATHTHSAPSTSSPDPIMDDYMDFLEEQMIAAAKTALADRKPAQMYTASTTLENMNFVRHYYMMDGTVAGDNFGNFTNNPILGHVREPDNEMQLIRFKRQGGKDVVLVNWQVHPIRSSSSRTFHISSDVVGAMREALEPQMDCYMAYFTGASGNIDPYSRIFSENITSNYKKQGAVMAQQAVLACDNMTLQKVGTVQTVRSTVPVPVNKMAIDFTIAAVSIGDVAFAIAPYEMFDTNGKFIKDNSPFEMTFVVTCANASRRYVAAEWAYAYDSYEASLGGYNKGSAEMLADEYVTLLKQLHVTRNVCENTDAVEQTDAELYFNLDKGEIVKPDANGVYTLRFLKDGEKVSLKIADQALLDAILQLDFVGLKLDGDTVTELVCLQNMPYQRLAWNYRVQSITETNVTLKPAVGVTGNVTLEHLVGVPMYDAVASSPTFGMAIELQKYDTVSIIADENGTPVMGYVTRHSRPTLIP